MASSLAQLRATYLQPEDDPTDLAISRIQAAYVEHDQPSTTAVTKLYYTYVAQALGEAADEASAPSPGLRYAIARAIGGPIFTFLGRLAVGAGRLVTSLARSLIFTAGRFVLRSLVVPLITGAISMLGPWGIGIAAVAGLGYFIYRAMFTKQPLGDIGAEDGEWKRTKASDKLHDSYEPVEPSARYDRSQYGQRESAQQMKYEGSSMGSATAGARLLRRRSESVKNTIKEASRITGVPESVLNAFAYKESSFNPNAKAPTSTAKGLFQFLDSTWKYVIGKYGSRYGIPSNANPFDPYANAVMGGAYLKHDIYPQIQKVVSTPTATDLYFGHFMGPAGGRNWLRNYHANPNAIAANDWPKAAASNRWVYYDKNGRPKTYDEIYRNYARSFVDVEAAVHAETSVQSTEMAPRPPVEVEKPSPAQQPVAQPPTAPVTVVGGSAESEVFSYKGVAMSAG